MDGEAYYSRCSMLLPALEKAEGACAGMKPRGALPVEVLEHKVPVG